MKLKALLPLFVDTYQKINIGTIDEDGKAITRKITITPENIGDKSILAEKYLNRKVYTIVPFKSDISIVLE